MYPHCAYQIILLFFCLAKAISLDTFTPSSISQPPNFTLENLPSWTDHLQQQFSLHDVSREVQAQVGIHFLESEKELQVVMDDRRKFYLKHSGEEWWSWEDFVEDLKNVTALAYSQKSSIDQKITELVESAKTFEESTVKALEQVVHDAEKFGAELKPVIDEAASSLENFWTHNALPAVEEAAHAVGGFFDKIFHPTAADRVDDSDSDSTSLSPPSPGESNPAASNSLHQSSSESERSRDFEVLKPAARDLLSVGSHLISSGETVINSLNTYLVQNVLPFLKDIQKLAEGVKKSVDVFRAQHPFIAASIGATLVVVGAGVIVPAVGGALLGVVGISSVGPVSGTLATMIQSSVYGAWTTGVFSALQSFAMTYVLPSIFALVAAGTVSAAGLYLFSSLWYDPSSAGPTSPSPSSAAAAGSEDDQDDLIPILQSWDPPLTFTGNNPSQDVMTWFGDIERACEERGIPKERWRDVAAWFFHVDMVEIV